MNEYFGSALVAHITISKDIFIGDDATEFNLEGEEASDLHKDSAVKKKNETVRNAPGIQKKMLMPRKERGDEARSPEAQPMRRAGSTTGRAAAHGQKKRLLQEETAQEEAPAVEETSEEAEAAVTEEAEEEAAATDSAEDTSADSKEDTQEADEPAEAEQKEAPVAKSKRVHPDAKKPSKPRKAKKVDTESIVGGGGQLSKSPGVR